MSDPPGWEDQPYTSRPAVWVAFDGEVTRHGAADPVVLLAGRPNRGRGGGVVGVEWAAITTPPRWLMATRPAPSTPLATYAAAFGVPPADQIPPRVVGDHHLLRVGAVVILAWLENGVGLIRERAYRVGEAGSLTFLGEGYTGEHGTPLQGPRTGPIYAGSAVLPPVVAALAQTQGDDWLAINGIPRLVSEGVPPERIPFVATYYRWIYEAAPSNRLWAPPAGPEDDGRPRPPVALDCVGSGPGGPLRPRLNLEPGYVHPPGDAPFDRYVAGVRDDGVIVFSLPD